MKNCFIILLLLWVQSTLRIISFELFYLLLHSGPSSLSSMNVLSPSSIWVRLSSYKYSSRSWVSSSIVASMTSLQFPPSFMIGKGGRPATDFELAYLGSVSPASSLASVIFFTFSMISSAYSHVPSLFENCFYKFFLNYLALIPP